MLSNVPHDGDAVAAIPQMGKLRRRKVKQIGNIGIYVQIQLCGSKPMLFPPHHATMLMLPNIHILIVTPIELWASRPGYVLLCVWMPEPGCISMTGHLPLIRGTCVTICLHLLPERSCLCDTVGLCSSVQLLMGQCNYVCGCVCSDGCGSVWLWLSQIGGGLC